MRKFRFFRFAINGVRDETGAGAVQISEIKLRGADGNPIDFGTAWANLVYHHKECKVSGVKLDARGSADSCAAAAAIAGIQACKQFMFAPKHPVLDCLCCEKDSDIDKQSNVWSVYSVELTSPYSKLRVTATNSDGQQPKDAGGDTWEGPAKAVDGTPGTKWLDYGRHPLQLEFTEPVETDAFSFWTANDFPERDPTQWSFAGSMDSFNWIILHNQTEKFENIALARETRNPWFAFTSSS